VKMITVFLVTQILERRLVLVTNVPPISNIPGTNLVSIPLYFVGDEAFPPKQRT